EELDAAIQENAPVGKLEDAEIQRLVALSNDASFQRSERVPVKSVEAFEPRSLVSIAMAAQRRRESELRTAIAAGATIDDEGADPEAAAADPAADPAGETDDDSGKQATPEVGADADGADAQAAVQAETAGDEAGEGESADDAPSSTSQVDFEAGRTEGLEEGRRVGFDEGQAKGIEEGRAAGRAEASAQLERAVQAFEAATARLSELTAVDSDALATSINDAILRLASARAGRAIAEQPDSFADRIEALLATIRTVSGQPSIRLNPADLASIQPLADTREKLRHCNFVADPSLANGDLSVMVGTIGIDDIIVPREPATDIATDGFEAAVPDAGPDVPATDTRAETTPDTASDAEVAPEAGDMSDSILPEPDATPDAGDTLEAGDAAAATEPEGTADTALFSNDSTRRASFGLMARRGVCFLAAAGAAAGSEAVRFAILR
ncbi:MAG: FliH/SctL family protein, partial [Pseudomonadota bacterium]|nr:FliH/SctL family protein [Pseudomonadota bacterium]